MVGWGEARNLRRLEEGEQAALAQREATDEAAFEEFLESGPGGNGGAVGTTTYHALEGMELCHGAFVAGRPYAGKARPYGFYLTHKEALKAQEEWEAELRGESPPMKLRGRIYEIWVQNGQAHPPGERSGAQGVAGWEGFPYPGEEAATKRIRRWLWNTPDSPFWALGEARRDELAERRKSRRD